MEPVYLVADEIQKENQTKATFLTHGRQLRNNQVTQEALDSTALGVDTGWVAIAPFSDNEVRVDFVPKGTKGAAKVKRNKNEHTALISARHLLSAHPDLKVEKGYLRQIAWRIEEIAGRKHFILQLKSEEIVPTQKRTGKKADPKGKVTGTETGGAGLAKK